MKTLSSLLIVLAVMNANRVSAAPGSPDLSFGGTGKVTIAFPGLTSEASAVATYPDGRIIVAGTVNGNFAVLRRNQNGSADTTFNGTGSAFASLGGGANYCTSMAIGPNGQIILAGYANAGTSFAVAGWDEDGFNTFKTETPGAGTGAGVAIQPNGKIVVVGNSGFSFTVARYDIGGVLDPTFDGDGIVRYALAFGNSVYGIAVQSDGKIVVVGEIHPTQNSVDFLCWHPSGPRC